MSLVKDIEAILPQTQCRECGYPGCLPYAQALAQNQAKINQCPPGGLPVLEDLGRLLKINPLPFREDMAKATRSPSVAVIREEECIGCTKCIKACPVDAIIGSRKLMHTIIAHECTGCGLCVEPCPVDCIDMQPLSKAEFDKDLARSRHQAKQIRLLREEHQQQQAYRKKRQLAEEGKVDEIRAKQAYIQQALARVKAKKPNE